MSNIEHWLSKTPPQCPATTEDGRACLLGIRHKGEHAWDGDEVESLRQQLRGAVGALERIAAIEVETPLLRSSEAARLRNAVSIAAAALANLGGR